MPKMKTHSGAKKRFKVTGTGKVRGRHPFTSHILEKKSPKKKRALGGPKMINEHDVPRIKRMLGVGQVTRVKRSVHARKKRRATLELTKGFRGEAHSNYKRAKEALMKADAYAYRDRRNRKRDFRRLWITRINAAARVERDELLADDARPEARRCRARPQGARGHRRARCRHVPTFCRGRPRGVGSSAPCHNGLSPSEDPLRAKKRFKVTATGKVRARHPFTTTSSEEVAEKEARLSAARR